MPTCSKCKTKVYCIHSVLCPVCKGEPIDCGDHSVVLEPIPFSEWPAWAKLIAKRRYFCEIGVGRTFERLIDARGGKWFKKISKSLGIPCGCSARRNEWNVKYSYENIF